MTLGHWPWPRVTRKNGFRKEEECMPPWKLSIMSCLVIFKEGIIITSCIHKVKRSSLQCYNDNYEQTLVQLLTCRIEEQIALQKETTPQFLPKCLTPNKSPNKAGITLICVPIPVKLKIISFATWRWVTIHFTFYMTDLCIPSVLRHRCLQNL